MISSPSGSPTILVFWRQNDILRGSPERAPQTRVGVEKFSHFLALSINISQTVADMANVTISY